LQREGGGEVREGRDARKKERVERHREGDEGMRKEVD